MSRLLLPFFVSCPGILLGQISVVDFEDGFDFDMTGVESFCVLGAVQSTTNTYNATSLWCAEIPAMFNSTCVVQYAPGLLVRLNSVAPGDQISIQHWQKLPPNGGGVITNLVYSYPSTGALPPNDLGLTFVGPAWTQVTTQGVWGAVTSPFELPSNMPWPSDVYYLMHIPTDSMSFQPTFIDDIVLFPDLGTGLHTNASEGPTLRVSPSPAVDAIVILGLDRDPVEIYNSAGACVHNSSFASGPGHLDVSLFSSGIYLLRQGKRSTRFVKM